MSTNRNQSGRFTSSDSPVDRKPETIEDKIRHVLESQLDRLVSRPYDASPSDVASLAKSLMAIMERASETPVDDDSEDTDAIVNALTTEEDARLDQLFREIDELKNIGLARLGRQQKAISKDPFEPVYTPTLDYVFTLIHRRDPSFAEMLDQFVTKHRHTLGVSWSRLEVSVEKHVVRQIEDLLSTQGLRRQFDDAIDELLTRTASETSSRETGPNIE